MTDRGRDAGADLACSLLLGMAVLSFFPHVLAGGVFFVQDVMVQNVPFRHSLHQALAAGRLPLWEPRIDAGFPLFAEGQVGALYPFNVLLAFLSSPARAVTASVVTHLWLAAVALFLFLRRGLGAGRAAALTGGLAYGLSGFLVVRAMSPNFLAGAAWIPILLLLVECGLRRGRPLWLAASGGVVALQLLAGHAQATSYGGLAAAAYGLVRAWQLGRLQRAWIGALLALPGVGMAAIQVLPTWDLAGLSTRAGRISYAQFVNMSLPPERLVTLLLPTFFGTSSTGTYWGRDVGFFIQLCPYVGVLTLALALIGARHGRSPSRGFFALLAVAGLVLSLGRYTGFFEVLHQVPILRQFRIPTRFLLWWALAASVLAGLGVDRLLDPRPLGAVWCRAWLCLGAVTAGAILVEAPALMGASGMRSLYRHELFVDGLRVLGGLGVAAGLCAGRFRRHPVAPGLVPALVVLATWADLRSFGAGFNGTLPEAVYRASPPTVEAIQADLERRWASAAGPGVPPAGLVRVASAVSERPGGYDWHGGWALDTSSYRAYPATLRPYSAGLFGLAGILPGWSPLHLKRQWEFASLNPRSLRLANVGYLVTEGPLRRPPGPSLPVVAGQLRVYRIDGALPRAYVVPRAVGLPTGAEAPRWLRSAGFDPRHTVLLETPPAVSVPGAASDLEPARIVTYEPERVVVELPHRGGYLVLSDTDAPGWEARVDGRLRPILRANHLFRAVAVGAGEARVEFTYRPAALWRGAWISAVAGLLWALVLTAVRRRHLGEAVEARCLNLGGVAVQVALIAMLYGIVRQTALWAGALERLRLPPGFGG